MPAEVRAVIPANLPVVDEYPWPAQSQWTYEDYLRLPDDGRRYEIIEGVLYVTNAPSFDHQFAITELLGELRNFVKERNLGVVLTAPFEVHLSETSRPVQPDIIFITADKQPAAGTQVFAGIPNLIAFFGVFRARPYI